MVAGALRRLVCCGGVEEDHRSVNTQTAAGQVQVAPLTSECDEAANAFVMLKAPLRDLCVPPSIQAQYSKVIDTSIDLQGQSLCLNQDVAVLGNVTITAGGVCVTGNVLVVGDVIIDGRDELTVNDVCIAGKAIVLGNVTIHGNTCVRSAFVKGNLQIKGNLKVVTQLCVWGNKDVRPDTPSPHGPGSVGP